MCSVSSELEICNTGIFWRFWMQLPVNQSVPLTKCRLGNHGLSHHLHTRTRFFFLFTTQYSLGANMAEELLSFFHHSTHLYVCMHLGWEESRTLTDMNYCRDERSQTINLFDRWVASAIHMRFSFASTFQFWKTELDRPVIPIH